jgi:hypothetical protein
LDAGDCSTGTAKSRADSLQSDLTSGGTRLASVVVGECQAD